MDTAAYTTLITHAPHMQSLGDSFREVQQRSPKRTDFVAQTPNNGMRGDAQVTVLRDVYTPLQHLCAELVAFPGLQDAIHVSDELLRRRAAASEHEGRVGSHSGESGQA